MFKNIGINLTGPICSCDKQNLIWGIFTDEENSPGLIITCKNCKTNLKIHNRQFKAYFKLDKGYPKGLATDDAVQEKEKEKEKLKEIDDDAEFLKSLKIDPNLKLE